MVDVPAGRGAITKTLQNFLDSERAGGAFLLVCTAISLALANSPAAESYFAVWETRIGGLSIEHWINDGLMAAFFLFVGLELERELYVGELSRARDALLPIIAALGGVVTPTLIHFAFNAGTPTQPGMGIPMATDIAFALGVLSLLGDRIPSSLKVFVVAFAVMDDLAAIIIIAIFYTNHLAAGYLIAAAAVWALLIALNRIFRVMVLTPYLLGGVVMWFFMLESGVHATLAGVLLAFAIPFSSRAEDEASPSHRLEHFLHKPVAFLVLPIFALANTALGIGTESMQSLSSPNSMGIVAGLVIGKPVGVTAGALAAVACKLCRLPADLSWRHIGGAGILGGIGFTMSIFITNLAFPDNPAVIDASKMAILLASAIAGTCGYLFLRATNRSAG